MTKPSKPSMERAREITDKWFNKNIGSFNSMGNCQVSESDLTELELAIAEALDAELARSAKLVEALEGIAAPVPDSEIPDFNDDDEVEKWMILNQKRRALAKQALVEHKAAKETE